jgi:hypothetical protein
LTTHHSELLDNPELVLTLPTQSLVLVGGVRMIFSRDNVIHGWGFFTTEASRFEDYERECNKIDEPDPFMRDVMENCIYPDYIQHVRPVERGAALCKLSDFVEMFSKGVDGYNVS